MMESQATLFLAHNAVIDLSLGRARGGGRSVSFTSMQLVIIRRLVRSAGGLVTHDQIIREVYPHPNSEPEFPAELIKVVISYIRTKLASIGAKNVIGTVWGRG